MSLFKPDIDDYKVLIDPTEKDFTSSLVDIILPMERLSNYVLISNRPVANI